MTDDFDLEPVRRHGVIRAAPDLPPGFLPPDLEGKWFDLDELPYFMAEENERAVAVITARFERREDGATARVFEVRP